MTPTLSVDPSWTLFFDRDGTLNKRLIGTYVMDWDQFEFLEDAIEGFAELSQSFVHTFIVTNQQGIGKELMTHDKLKDIHNQMMERLIVNGGRIDEIYYCPDLASEDPFSRKPNPGMAIQAATDFPNVIFEKSIMIGDTQSDMEFGQRLGMKTVLIRDKENQNVASDLKINKLTDLMQYLIFD